MPVLMKFQIYIISVHVGTTLSLATVHTIDCLVSSRFTRHNLGAPWILKSLQPVRRPVTKNARHGPYDRNTTSLKFSRRDFFLREGVTCYESSRVNSIYLCFDACTISLVTNTIRHGYRAKITTRLARRTMIRGWGLLCNFTFLYA